MTKGQLRGCQGKKEQSIRKWKAAERAGTSTDREACHGIETERHLSPLEKHRIRRGLVRKATYLLHHKRKVP